MYTNHETEAQDIMDTSTFTAVAVYNVLKF